VNIDDASLLKRASYVKGTDERNAQLFLEENEKKVFTLENKQAWDFSLIVNGKDKCSTLQMFV
jgi:hypothetical protein